jgi:hypothetical protein
MKRQIRRGVFESNSSSSHSLTVMKRDDKYTTEEILYGLCLWDDKETGEKNCIWEPYDGDMEFGRSPFRAIGTFADKWLYACASLVHEYKDDTYKELEALALKYIPGLKKIQLPLIGESVPNKDNEEFKESEYGQKYGKTEDELAEYLIQKEKDWGIEIDYWETASGYWHYEKPYTGYVDENMLGGFLKSEGISLEEFLINKKYVVIQDGDEYCYWQDMKDVGLINIDAIDHEYPEED